MIPSLPSPELSPIPVERLEAMTSYADAMAVIGDGMGALPPATVEELEKRLGAYRRGECSLDAVINTSSMARAFLSVYSTKAELRDAIPYTRDLSSRLAQVLSTHLAPLARLYFEHYDTLEGHHYLGGLLFIHYQSRPDLSRLTSTDRSYAENVHLLFGKEGPKSVADEAIRRDISLRELESVINIPAIGEFHDRSYRRYYVSHAAEVPHGQLSDILQETLKPDLHNLPLDDRMLGHQMIETLVRRCINERSVISKPWLSYILKIAGDPRLPASHKNFQKWWMIQPPEIVRKMKASLARRDLNFFLELLGNFAQSEGGDMARMYPARRKFLEGFLAANDVVRDALLILSPEGKKYIKSQLPPDERREFSCSVLTGSNTLRQSAIYLELPTGHLIEGSHQSLFRIYQAEAAFPVKLRDKRPQTVPYQDITGSDPSFEKRHHPEVGWQHNILCHLAQYDYGVDIDPESALSTSDYTIMTKKYGIPR